VEGEKRTASLFNQWIDRAKEVLRDCIPANMVLLRGFASYLSIPKFSDLYKMRACCIATYPMYKGIARLLGMDVAEGAESVGDQFGLLAENYSSYDFFFLHIKETDKAGEDGDQRKKCEVIEEVDRLLPRILELKPDLLVITGDHSTPASLRSHSFHPVPLLIHTKHCIPDGILRFSEREARLGSLGRFPMQELMGILLGLSMRLAKYGA
jgi:2,3-bisphosphoglycerate-independent phosphoglycerate mutase